MAPQRVLLVDDQKLFLEGLANILALGGVEVVDTAGNGFEALEKARLHRPDVVLMDVRMPRCDGVQATRLLMAEMPSLKIVMLTASEDDDSLFAAIKAGASGYLLKNLDGAAFFAMLRSLSAGEAPLAPGIATRLLKEFARRSAVQGAVDGGPAPIGLHPRQMAILELVAQGLTYRQIGAELCLSERTIKYHVAQIMERLHVKSRAEAIALARRAGLMRGTEDTGPLGGAKEDAPAT